MNYLAHIYLSGDDPDLKIGGLLGDFVKGPVHQFQPERFQTGIQLHRQIDAYIDALDETRQGLELLGPQWRRYGGILLDVLFDHYLAKDWQHYHPQPLATYCQQFYRELKRHRHDLPPGAQRFADVAPQVGWLESYADFDNLRHIFSRIDQRLKRPVSLENAVAKIDQHYEELQQLFCIVIANADNFSASKRAG
ncbi:MAG: acyl carrier protein phosphodiesterase [bacterium]